MANNNSFDWSSLVGASFGGLGTMISNINNKKIAQWNIQAQKDINAQNLAFQQKEAEITRAREDNAIRRAMADVTASGLSKTLATGNSASSNYMNPYMQTAPQNDFKYQSALEKLSLGNLILEGKKVASDIAVNDARKQQMELQYKRDAQVFDWYNDKGLPADGSAKSPVKVASWIEYLDKDPVAHKILNTVGSAIDNANKFRYFYGR